MKPLILLVLLSGVAISSSAPSEERDARADAVVVATVEESRTIVHRKPGSALFYVRLKAKVASVEKGRDLVRGAGHLDIRCWNEGAEGHIPIPVDGSEFRAWLVKHAEGHWTPLEPDGFELAQGAAAMTFPRIERKHSATSYVVGGIFGLAVLLTAAVVKYRSRRPRDTSWGEPRDGEASE